MKTHYDRLLAYLKVYGSITSLEAIRDLGNTRISATIFNLRKDGYMIETEYIKVPTRFVKPNGEKHTTTVAKYVYSKVNE